MKTQLEKLAELEVLVGNTPMVEITYKYNGKVRKVFAKLEYYNFSGSIKDRMALSCLKQAYLTGRIKEGYTITETTSGNAGIAFCALGRYLGHKCLIFMPKWMSEERVVMMKSYGAKVERVCHEEGGFLGCIEKTKAFAAKGEVYYPDQFSNEYNVKAHFTGTGPEILKQMEKLGEKIHGIVAGVGTGGTIMGIGKYLKCVDPRIKAFPMEPESSPTLSTGYKVGTHRIQGVSDEFIPAILDLDFCDSIIMVDDGDAIIMAQMLCKSLGLGVGISSGANFLAAIRAAELIGKDANIVTLFSDDNKKYFSTDYVKDEPVKEGFLSTNVELIGLRSVK